VSDSTTDGATYATSRRSGKSVRPLILLQFIVPAESLA
jgi:hypothetical protein